MAGRRNDTFNQTIQEVRAAYDALATRPIERNCTMQTECCRFRLTGRTPFLTRGEAILAAKAFKGTGRKELPDNRNGECPLLHPETGRCMIYKDRPFGCRTHFCQPAGGPYKRGEVADLIQRLEKIGTDAGGREAQSIVTAVREALKEMR